MENEKNDKFIKALESNDSLLEFIKEQSISGGFAEKAIDTVRGPHPTKENLYDYVLNWSDKKIENLIMEHIVICPRCSQEILDIMEIEQELDEDLLAWAEKISLTQKIKNLISEVSLPVYGIPVGAAVTRSTTKYDTRQYSIGDSFVFCIPVVSDGYLVILHYDEKDNVSLIFPSNKKDSAFVRKGSEKKISGKVTGPTGKQFFKVFWTKKNVLNTDKIDFKNENSVEYMISDYIDSLTELKVSNWCESIYEYEVIQ
jgi:hypothetical protein